MDLFRFLQKAQLASYYDSFVRNGGDDIHQLLEASEEELREILHIVGMDSNPLHIVRLKQALNDCRTHPDKFLSSDGPPPGAASATLSSHQLQAHHQQTQQLNLTTGTTSQLAPFTAIPNMIFTVNDPLRNYSNVSAFQPANMTISALPTGQTSIALQPNNLLTVGQVLTQQPQAQGQQPGQQQQQGQQAVPTSGPGEWVTSGTGAGGATVVQGVAIAANTTGTPQNRGIPVNMLNNASLTPDEKRMIESAADDLVKAIPEYPIKDASPSRKKEAGLYEVIKMSSDNASRAAAIYRYSAIYGRFNKARKTGKPMNHHEVAVNEAASQLCLRMPSLLSRREDLYPLARQVVKIAEESWKSNYRSRSHKKKKPNPSVVAIANEFATLHQTNQQVGYLRAQEKIETVKAQLCEIVTQQDKLRMLFRAAKNGAAGPSMADIQKQIDHLSGVQQLRIAELGRYVLELRKFRGELTNPQSATTSRSSTSGVEATLNALTATPVSNVSISTATSGSISSTAGLSLVTNTLSDLQHQQPHFLADVVNQQHLLSLAPSAAPNVFTVFPSTLSSAAGGVPQLKTESTVHSTASSGTAQAPGTTTFFLSNNPMAALNALPNSAPGLGTYTVNNTATSAGVTQFPSFSVFTSFGQLKAVQAAPGTAVSDGSAGSNNAAAVAAAAGNMMVQGMKIDPSTAVVSSGNVAGQQYNLIRNS